MGETDRTNRNKDMTYNEERQKLNDLQAEYHELEARMVELRAEMSAKHEQIMQQRLVCANMLNSAQAGMRYTETSF